MNTQSKPDLDTGILAKVEKVPLSLHDLLNSKP